MASMCLYSFLIMYVVTRIKCYQHPTITYWSLSGGDRIRFFLYLPNYSVIIQKHSHQKINQDHTIAFFTYRAAMLKGSGGVEHHPLIKNKSDHDLRFINGLVFLLVMIFKIDKVLQIFLYIKSSNYI